MPSPKAIIQANSALSCGPLSAVFVGATSGIGLGAIQAVLRHVPKSTIFIVGRSASKFEPEMIELRRLDPHANITFIEAQVSLLKEVERACREIQQQTGKLDLLWLSQGGLSSKAQEFTSEGLYMELAVAYYSRMLFTTTLLPLLEKSEVGGRVVSVLSAGEEGKVDASDFGIKKPSTFQELGFWGRLKQGVTLTSLAMQDLAQKNPKLIFMHTFPGFVTTPVHTKWADTMTGWMAPLGWILRLVVLPITKYFGISPAQAGEVGLFEATDKSFQRPDQNFFRLKEDAEDVGDRGTEFFLGNKNLMEELSRHTTETFKEVI